MLGPPLFSKEEYEKLSKFKKIIYWVFYTAVLFVILYVWGDTLFGE